VADGRAAVSQWQTGKYDLILMDCRMPEMDGYDAAREIRQRETDAARIPS
jgi:CheY-like chemotaxis protein